MPPMKSKVFKAWNGFSKRYSTPRPDPIEVSSVGSTDHSLISPTNSATGNSDISSARSKSSTSSDSIESVKDDYDMVTEHERTLSRALPSRGDYRVTSNRPMSVNIMGGLFNSSRPHEAFAFRRDPITLPDIRNTCLFGNAAKMDYDHVVALSLYNDPGDKFDSVIDPSYDMIARLMPKSRAEPTRSLFHDRIATDLTRRIFDFHIEKAIQYIDQKYRDSPQCFFVREENIENIEFRSIEHMKEAARTVAMCSIGKASTMSLDNIYKIARRSQSTSPIHST